MRALDGIRLLDLTHMLSGPYATMLLADLGAETIKIEPPGSGEATRRLLSDNPAYSMHGMGVYFYTLNRNKKSVMLNLKSEQGRVLFYELAAQADVVVDNFSVGVTERLKISYPFLSELNPRLITCSVTGFGQSGPDKDRVAFDLVAQAMGGVMSITGRPGDPPTRAGVPLGDLGGGLMAVIGILAALVARQQTGRGQHVDISMLDAQLGLLNYILTMYTLSGVVPGPTGNGHFLHIPYDTYPVSDGWIVVAVIIDHFWHTLLKVLDLQELDTEQHATATGRSRNADEINARLCEKFKEHPQAYWLEVLQAARIPCAPVYDLEQAINNPQIRQRNMLVDVPHPYGGSVQQPGNPIKLSATSDDIFTAPPLPGEHTDEILREYLGKSPDEILALRLDGVI